MPKLVITDSTMKMLVKKLSGFPIHAGPRGEFLAPGIQDLVDGNDESNPWQPADERTKLLALGGEACRDLVFHVQQFHEATARKRILKNLSIPVCNLMDVVTKLHKTFNDEDSRTTRLGWPLSDQNSYVKVARRIRKTHLQGPVRNQRHKVAAHLDLEAFTLRNLNSDSNSLLCALADSLIILMLSFNHKARAFSWIRPVAASEDGAKIVVDTMFDYPASVRWITDPEGNVLDVEAIHLAEDPRHKIHESAVAAVNVYNYLIKETNTQSPELYVRPSVEVLREEGRPTPQTLSSAEPGPIHVSFAKIFDSGT